jgi:short-subunit dehydrogenase
MERRLAAVTGASTGMGAEFARQLAAQGYDLLLIARRTEQLQRVCDQVTAVHNVRCDILTADLADEDQLLTVETRLRESENLALLVNNAGFGTLGKFYKAPIDGQDRMHRVHVMAAMRLCHAVLPGMVARNSGAIVNVSSVAGFVLSAGSTSYCATKAWMNRFTEGLYLELKDSRSRVKVQALCPGYTHTEFHQTLAMDTSRIPEWMWLSADRVVRESLRAIPSGKLFVIPGRRYRAALRFYAMLPREARHQVGLGGARFRKPSAK